MDEQKRDLDLKTVHLEPGLVIDQGETSALSALTQD